MKRYLPLVMSILANIGGGAAGVGIAYLLDPILPAFGGEARQLDRDFFAAIIVRLGCAVSPFSTVLRPLPGLPPLWFCQG